MEQNTTRFVASLKSLLKMKTQPIEVASFGSVHAKRRSSMGLRGELLNYLRPGANPSSAPHVIGLAGKYNLKE